MSPEEKCHIIAEKMREILATLGLDLSDPSLAKTPERVAHMYVYEIFSGLDPTTFPEITLHPYEGAPGEMVFVKNISLVSFCEHHLVPMVGLAQVAYLPKESIIGLSKINRLVRHFARRPQLQERLTAQIATTLADLLKTPDVAVSISAHHHCVSARGIEDTQSLTETHTLRGAFERDTALKAHFLGRDPKPV